MAFDNTKYDIELNGVPYRIGDYNRTKLNTFVPRIGGGDQTETDFSLLRSKSMKGFAGGQLQRFWKEDTAFYGSEGLYPIYGDGILYPVNEPVSDTELIGASKARATAWCSDERYVFIASVSFNLPTPRILRIEKTTGTETVLTLPATLTSLGSAITSMVIWNDQLWIVGAYAVNVMWYMPLSSTTVSAITAGTGNLSLLVVYKGSLYGTTANESNRILYRYSGTTATKAFVRVGNTGQNDADYYASIFVFNNRIFFTRKEGMWAYDGVSLTSVEDQTNNVHLRNYRFPRVLKGFLYYWMPDGMYRFNGAIVEKLYDISEVGFPQDVSVGKNRIWMIYRNSDNGSSRFDRLMGYDYSSGDNVDGRVVAFNGEGMFTYARTSTFVKDPPSEDVSDQGAVDKVMWFDDVLYITTYYEKTLGNEYFTIDTNELAVTGLKPWRLISSIFDGDFPMVDKAWENTELLLDGDVSLIDSNDEIILSVRDENFDTQAGWEVVGDFMDYAELKLNAHIVFPDGFGFRNSQFLYSGETHAGYGIKDIVTRYRLAAEHRWEWQLTARCYGDSITEPLQLADLTNSAQTVMALRGNLYDATSNEFPSIFVDVDQLELETTINNSVTSVTLSDASLIRHSGGSYLPGYGSGGFIQIDDEIMFWTDLNKTTGVLTISKRGALGTSAASHTAGAKVFLVYRVTVDIRNERIILNDDGAPALGSARPSDVTLLLQEV